MAVLLADGSVNNVLPHNICRVTEGNTSANEVLRHVEHADRDANSDSKKDNERSEEYTFEYVAWDGGFGATSNLDNNSGICKPRVGTKVTLKGLIAHTHLNGAKGTCGHSSDERVAVTLKDGSIKNIKFKNLSIDDSDNEKIVKATAPVTWDSSPHDANLRNSKNIGAKADAKVRGKGLKGCETRGVNDPKARKTQANTRSNNKVHSGLEKWLKGIDAQQEIAKKISFDIDVTKNFTLRGTDYPKKRDIGPDWVDSSECKDMIVKRRKLGQSPRYRTIEPSSGTCDPNASSSNVTPGPQTKSVPPQ